MRRNTLPVKRIDRSLVMRHEHAARAVGELRQSGKPSSGAAPVRQHAPEAFQRVAVGRTRASTGWRYGRTPSGSTCGTIFERTREVPYGTAPRTLSNPLRIPV